MRPEIVMRYLGFILLINALFLLISTAISWGQGDGSFAPLLFSAAVSFLFGVFPLIFVPPALEITNKEGLFIVVLGWLISCLVGVMPYVLWGGPFTFTNAWFESVSGFTTTGSSILSDIEGIPPGLLFWRASTHWLGGIGIIVFVLAVMPSMGPAAMVLYRSEISSLATDNFRYRTQKTLMIILYVYVGLTVLETLALLTQGLSLFDAVAHSFATIATGGFSTKNTSIAHFASPGVESILMVFMLVSGIHFGLLYLFATGSFRKIFESAMVRYYLGAVVLGVFAVCISVYTANYDSLTDALRYSAFQVLSVGTSTGFANADSSVWPPLSQLVLLFFTLQCACAGSTSGGIKVDRIVLFGKTLEKQIFKLRHPKGVFAIKIKGATVDEEIVEAAMVYILLYLGILLASTMIITAFHVDLLSAFSGAAAAMGNVGPGFGSVGSMANYAHLPSAVKWILTADMLLGRLEIFALILFVTIRRWK
ncbi:MAG: TrkH family potassium uptake protein [Desulfobacterales bacterium]|nr:TrkH family potassium uptake protein [Desulfobacterales bacterium]